MLQEIVIPVITVTEMKGKHLEKSEVRQVGVSLLGSYKKLVTNRPIYKLIQTDPVSERMKPITLKVANKNNLIHAFTFDNFSRFQTKVPYDKLNTNKLISGANLVTAECLSPKKFIKICKMGFGNGENNHV